MVTITLTPELEQAVNERARQQGTTPELLIQNDLRQKYLPAESAAMSSEGETMAEFFAGYIGSVNSSDLAPEGSDLSEDTGRKFKELLLKRQAESKL